LEDRKGRRGEKEKRRRGEILIFKLNFETFRLLIYRSKSSFLLFFL
jgi:hypothetical protein